MRIELISTGDEVITGNIDDTNASFLSRELFEAGLQVDRRHTSGDSLTELMELFYQVSQKEAIVIATGGMGPTNDDLTTEAIAKVANVPLQLNTTWYERMKAWFDNRGRFMAHSNLKQAMLPQGAIMIDNPTGTACGFAIKVNQALFIFLPGVPRELKAMWESSVKEMVISYTNDTVPRTHLIKLFLMGIGESTLMSKLAPIELPQGITIGDRAIYPFIELKIIGHDASDQDMFEVLGQVMNIVSPYYVCRDHYSLIESLNAHKIQLNAINAIDGVTRGWLLIHMQELFKNFVACSVLNATNNELNEQEKGYIAKHLEHAPNFNKISLLPCQQAIDVSLLKEYPYCYEFSFNLDYKQEDDGHNLTGRYLIALKEDVSSHALYSRNRDFLAHLCCVELYKLLVNEPTITPEDCKILMLDCKRSSYHLSK